MLRTVGAVDEQQLPVYEKRLSFWGFVVSKGLLISCCNVKRPFGHLSLVYMDLEGNTPWFVRLEDIPAVERRIAGITGLASSAGQYFAALQTGPDGALAVFDETLKVRNVIQIPGTRDLHGLRSDGDRLLVVSTGTDEIFSVDPSGKTPPELFWSPSRRQARRIHVNDVIRFGGRYLICAHRLLDTAGKADGNILDHASNEVLARGMLQPHTFMRLGERLLLCDSQRGQVVEFCASGIAPVFGQNDRFYRGMALVGEQVVVASSCQRIFSRSRGTAKRYAEQMRLGDGKYMSWLYFLDRSDFSVRSVIPFSAIAFEVYDILPVEREPCRDNLIPIPAAVRAQAFANRLADLEIQLDLSSGRSEGCDPRSSESEDAALVE